MFKRLHLAAAAVLLAVSGSLGAAFITAAPASAACAPNSIQGDWHNVNAQSRSLVRVVVETCQSVTTCNGSTCTIRYDAADFIHPYGACTPTACDWGRRQAQDMGGGWERSVHDFGFKTSSVWVKTYQYYGLTYLRVWVWNDFTPADGRTDYATDDWFLK